MLVLFLFFSRSWWSKPWSLSSAVHNWFLHILRSEIMCHGVIFEFSCRQSICPHIKIRDIVSWWPVYNWNSEWTQSTMWVPAIHSGCSFSNIECLVPWDSRLAQLAVFWTLLQNVIPDVSARNFWCCFCSLVTVSCLNDLAKDSYIVWQSTFGIPLKLKTYRAPVISFWSTNFS